MYLTRFPVNVTRRETRRMLMSPYRLHAAIQGSVPAHEPAQVGRTLWRIDHEPDGSVTLYIVSTAMPSLVGLDEQIGWPDIESQWQTRDYDQVLDRLEKGQTYRFRLTANPIVSRSAIKSPLGRSKRLPHVTVLQQESWLIGEQAYDAAGIAMDDRSRFLLDSRTSRAQRNGFEVACDQESGMPLLAVTESRQETFRQGRSGNQIKLQMARYDGVLEVTDVSLLRHALTCGIGKAKGFGCGLMTLARA